MQRVANRPSGPASALKTRWPARPVHNASPPSVLVLGECPGEPFGGRVQIVLQDVELPLDGPDREHDGLARSPRDRPSASVEVDAPAKIDLPAFPERQEQLHLLERGRHLHPGVTELAAPGARLVRGATEFAVDVLRVPVPVVLEGHLVRMRLVRHALCPEHDREAVLEGPHVPLDLALGLRCRGDAVQDPEGAAGAPELGLEVDARGPEHRESVRVEFFGDAHVRDHLLERREVLDDRLALAYAAGEHVPRRVVLRDDDGLPRAGLAPEVQGRRVVLDEFAEVLARPSAHVLLRPAFDREDPVQQLREVRLAVLPDVGPVAPEAELPFQLVGVELVVRPVPARREEHPLEVLHALGRPVGAVVPAGHTGQEDIRLALREPLRLQPVELRTGDVQRGRGGLRRDAPVVPFAQHARDDIGSDSVEELLSAHAGIIPQNGLSEGRNRLGSRRASKMRQFCG